MTNEWRPVDLLEETSWLSEKHREGSTAGYDINGWEDSTWILHAMYEMPGLDGSYTHDDVRKAELAAGAAPRSAVEELLGEATNTGVPLGLTVRPDGAWSRVTWADLSSRLRLDFGDNEYPPCFRWFSYRSWPASMQPPAEGSLDQESLNALTRHLANYSSDCLAAYCLVSAGMDESTNRCFIGPLDGVGELVGEDKWFIGTPNNMWDRDRTWFVYTDWDLWGTKVSGPRSLIDAIRSDADLETIDWIQPD